MDLIITKHQDKLGEICRHYRIARLEVFGSAATGGFNRERSDLDFLVEFGEVPPGERFDTFFGFQRALAELFGRAIDLVESGAPRNPYFIRRLNQSRRLVYAA